MSITIVYRKSDKLVAGWVYPPNDVNLEIQNITNSDLGGVTTDYATSVYPGNSLPDDHEFIINGDLTVTTQVRAEITQRNSDRDAAITKLKAATWSPLTDAELKAIFGSNIP